MKRRKKLAGVVIPLIPLMAVLTGCEGIRQRMTQSTAMSTKVEKYGVLTTVNVHSRMLDENIVVLEKNVRKRNGLMEAQVRGQNTSKHDLQFEYRFVWMDADGFPIESVTSVWKPLNLRARDTAWMNGIAPDPRAVDFQMSVRWADRENDRFIPGDSR